mmetsp:Transcript_10930/g.16644  ORF Transcript_10930/g.16644 Transcript_10930/m.16644 type:complete len:188 (+) Transcript_10930:97-660(+)
MSLTALAVTNRQNTPLYLRDYATESNLLFDLTTNHDDLFDDDLTPLEEITSKQKEEWPCLLKYQFILHSACDRLEQILRDNNWKSSGAVTSGMDACWVGLLCSSDNLRAYGYVTTNAKYVTLVEDSIPPENVQFQKSRDNEICVLMANVHRLYTESLMNPFTKLHSKITSQRFDRSVTNLVRSFNGL